MANIEHGRRYLAVGLTTLQSAEQKAYIQTVHTATVLERINALGGFASGLAAVIRACGQDYTSAAGSFGEAQVALDADLSGTDNQNAKDVLTRSAGATDAATGLEALTTEALTDRTMKLQAALATAATEAALLAEEWSAVCEMTNETVETARGAISATWDYFEETGRQ